MLSNTPVDNIHQLLKALGVVRSLEIVSTIMEAENRLNIFFLTATKWITCWCFLFIHKKCFLIMLKENEQKVQSLQKSLRPFQKKVTINKRTDMDLEYKHSNSLTDFSLMT